MYYIVFVILSRLKDIQKLTDEDVLFVQDDDTLIMRLNPNFKRGNDYGKKTYTPVIQQTDHGISKFYSILKYLVCFLHTLHVYK